MVSFVGGGLRHSLQRSKADSRGRAEGRHIQEEPGKKRAKDGAKGPKLEGKEEQQSLSVPLSLLLLLG